MEKKHIITALVSNKFGVLNRITGLFSKRGYNIESLIVASTEDEEFSRMTIVAVGNDAELAQITKQLRKLVDVVHVNQLSAKEAVSRELLLIKIAVTPAQRPEVESTIRTYKAKSVDLTQTTQTIELTGESGKIDGFIEILAPYGILEMARTGVTALARGTRNIKDTAQA